MDMLLSKYGGHDMLRKYMINVNVITGILEQAFETYVSSYNRTSLLPKENRIFKYQEFKDFLVAADII